MDVGGLAAVINSRLAAESRISRAVAFSWLCGGAAIAICMVGLGVAFAFLGYSYMLSVKPAAEQTAQAIVKAFEHAELKAIVSGKMVLDPNSEIKFAAGQMVKLNEGAIVKLDPTSSVRVVGDLKYDVPQPSKQQLQEDATIGDDELPFTSYTIFKSTNYNAGAVVTGWNFELSDPIKPKYQFCYYTQSIAKGAAYKYTIAVNDAPITPSPLAKLTFNLNDAVSNCIWFSGV
jgi:hypothetical protein